MGWDNKNGKHFSLVCATHDRELGRLNLMKLGMPMEECILFEDYCKETVDLLEHPDWPEWLNQRGRTYTPLTPLGKSYYTGTTSVELLGLSPRTWNTLQRNGITTIEKLANTSPYELLKIRTLGKKGVAEIQEKLGEFQK